MTFEQFRKLSPAQQVFMDACALYGRSRRPTRGLLGHAQWLRTAQALQARKLIVVSHYGNGVAVARLAPGVTTEWQRPVMPSSIENDQWTSEEIARWERARRLRLHADERDVEAAREDEQLRKSGV